MPARIRLLNSGSNKVGDGGVKVLAWGGGLVLLLQNMFIHVPMGMNYHAWHALLVPSVWEAAPCQGVAGVGHDYPRTWVECRLGLRAL